MNENLRWTVSHSLKIIIRNNANSNQPAGRNMINTGVTAVGTGTPRTVAFTVPTGCHSAVGFASNHQGLLNNKTAINIREWDTVQRKFSFI